VGEGEVVDGTGRRRPAGEALAAAGMAPLVLEAKEGLALTNGTDGMQGMLCLAYEDIYGLFRTADVAAAMSVEALLGTDQAFLPELIQLRPHPGQAASAANLLALLAGSGVVASHRRNDTRVQDAYSLRCAPQVLGAGRDTLEHAGAVLERELRSAIDNPVVLPDGRVSSCGNFHGAPVGYVADFLAIALADAASMSERRIDRHLDPARSHGLPPFLAAEPGVDSGLMLAQYTAAALVADCRRLAVPASVDSIPTSAMQEDHVSMGWAAGRQLRTVVDNLTRVVAIEVMTAARAVELRAPHQPAPATQAVLAGLRHSIPGVGPDRYLAPEIDHAADLVRSGKIVEWAESVTGPLA
jgi:histidine ammonia-lyase